MPGTSKANKNLLLVTKVNSNKLKIPLGLSTIFENATPDNFKSLCNVFLLPFLRAKKQTGDSFIVTIAPGMILDLIDKLQLNTSGQVDFLSSEDMKKLLENDLATEFIQEHIKDGNLSDITDEDFERFKTKIREIPVDKSIKENKAKAVLEAHAVNKQAMKDAIDNANLDANLEPKPNSQSSPPLVDLEAKNKLKAQADDNSRYDDDSDAEVSEDKERKAQSAPAPAPQTNQIAPTTNTQAPAPQANQIAPTTNTQAAQLTAIQGQYDNRNGIPIDARPRTLIRTPVSRTLTSNSNPNPIAQATSELINLSHQSSTNAISSPIPSPNVNLQNLIEEKKEFFKENFPGLDIQVTLEKNQIKVKIPKTKTQKPAKSKTAYNPFNCAMELSPNDKNVNLALMKNALMDSMKSGNTNVLEVSSLKSEEMANLFIEAANDERFKNIKFVFKAPNLQHLNRTEAPQLPRSRSPGGP